MSTTDPDTVIAGHPWKEWQRLNKDKARLAHLKNQITVLQAEQKQVEERIEKFFQKKNQYIHIWFYEYSLCGIYVTDGIAQGIKSVSLSEKHLATCPKCLTRMIQEPEAHHPQCASM